MPACPNYFLEEQPQENNGKRIMLTPSLLLPYSQPLPNPFLFFLLLFSLLFSFKPPKTATAVLLLPYYYVFYCSVATFSISHPEYLTTSMLPHCSVPSTHIMWLPCITENETACLITEIISEYTGTWVVNNSQKRQRRFQVPGQGKGRELPLGRWQLYPGQKGSLVSLITDLEFVLRATEYIHALPRVTVSVP